MAPSSLPRIEAEYSLIVEFKKYQAIENADMPFDPASVSKIFYALYLLKYHSLSELSSLRVEVKWSDIRKYGKGTRQLNYWHVGRVLGIDQLLHMMMINSCNVSTGIIADVLGRESVNDFIRNELGLEHTTIYTKKTPNITTVKDLYITLKHITTGKFLSQGKREILFSIMENPKRRAVIKNTLAKIVKWQVYSKGGTTFNGARRDLALVKTGDGYGYVIAVQHPQPMPKFTVRDKLYAKLGYGKLSDYLQALQREFNGKVKEALEPLVFVRD